MTRVMLNFEAKKQILYDFFDEKYSRDEIIDVNGISKQYFHSILNSDYGKQMRATYVKDCVAKELLSCIKISQKVLDHFIANTDQFLTKDVSLKDVMGVLDKAMSIQEGAFRMDRLLNEQSTENIALKVDVRELMHSLKDQKKKGVLNVTEDKMDLLEQDLSRGLLHNKMHNKGSEKPKEKGLLYDKGI